MKDADEVKAELGVGSEDVSTRRVIDALHGVTWAVDTFAEFLYRPILSNIDERGERVPADDLTDLECWSKMQRVLENLEREMEQEVDSHKRGRLRSELENCWRMLLQLDWDLSDRFCTIQPDQQIQWMWADAGLHEFLPKSASQSPLGKNVGVQIIERVSKSAAEMAPWRWTKLAPAHKVKDDLRKASQYSEVSRPVRIKADGLCIEKQSPAEAAEWLEQQTEREPGHEPEPEPEPEPDVTRGRTATVDTANSGQARPDSGEKQRRIHIKLLRQMLARREEALKIYQEGRQGLPADFLAKMRQHNSDYVDRIETRLETERELQRVAEPATEPWNCMTAAEREARKLPLRILTIDGGGIKGLMPAIVLEHIEDLCAPHKIHELFDLVGGTSTGGLIALGTCAAKVPVRLLTDVYENRGDEVFESKNGYVDGTGLEGILKDFARERSTYPPSQMPLESSSAADGPKVFVVATEVKRVASDAPAWSKVLFRTYSERNLNRPESSPFDPAVPSPPASETLKLWHAGRATSAAQYYDAAPTSLKDSIANASDQHRRWEGKLPRVLQGILPAFTKPLMVKVVADAAFDQFVKSKNSPFKMFTPTSFKPLSHPDPDRGLTTDTGQLIPDAPELMSHNDVQLITTMIVGQMLELWRATLHKFKESVAAILKIVKSARPQEKEESVSHQQQVASQANALLDMKCVVLQVAASKGINMSGLFDVMHTANAEPAGEKSLAEHVREFMASAGKQTSDTPELMSRDEVQNMTTAIIGKMLELWATLDTEESVTAMVEIVESATLEEKSVSHQQRLIDQASALVHMLYFVLNVATKNGINMSALFDAVGAEEIIAPSGQRVSEARVSEARVSEAIDRQFREGSWPSAGRRILGRGGWSLRVRELIEQQNAGIPRWYADGGPVANNPVEEALREAQEIWGDRKVGLVVSLGCGKRMSELKHDPSSSLGALGLKSFMQDIGAQVADCAAAHRAMLSTMRLDCKESIEPELLAEYATYGGEHDDARGKARDERLSQALYLRLNPEIDRSIKMDQRDDDTIHYMRDAAERCLAKQETKTRLAQMVGRLKPE
eukprot:COSAG04_NODE_33_length_34808_cov_6.920366_4_plen_1073_part_00